MVTSPQFCKQCGATLPAEAVFCEQCGTRINTPLQPQAMVYSHAPKQEAYTFIPYYLEPDGKVGYWPVSVRLLFAPDERYWPVSLVVEFEQLIPVGYPLDKE